MSSAVAFLPKGRAGRVENRDGTYRPVTIIGYETSESSDYWICIDPEGEASWVSIHAVMFDDRD